MMDTHHVGNPAGEDFAAGEDSKANHSGGGDGMHHHEVHEDEGGGYHSKHTHPDGRVEHADHATYDEASDHMDRSFGHGPEEEDPDHDGDMHADDAAGSYGRAACK